MCPALNKIVDQHDIPLLITLLAPYRKILLWGKMGIGKSTLAVHLLQYYVKSNQRCMLMELDSGTPPFGVPGAISIGTALNGTISPQCMRPLCSLNSARFRLPLIIEAQELAKVAKHIGNDSKLLIDPPGVVRGVGGAELLLALAASLEIDAIVFLDSAESNPLVHELASITVDVICIKPSNAAKIPSKSEKDGARTKLWNTFLQRAIEENYDLNTLNLLGTPPPFDIPDAWCGRQIALLGHSGSVVGMGELIVLDGFTASAKIVKLSTDKAHNLLLRDAGRHPSGRLCTMPIPQHLQNAKKIPAYLTATALHCSEELSPPISCQIGDCQATLVGGVFGDPLLIMRLNNQKRSFFFDLGDPRRLQAKIAHQVEAVFLSHAHLDHIGGFIWFLRSRIGPFGSCKIFGPPGITGHISHFIAAITWDRIDDLGPVFEIAEIHDQQLIRTRLQPGNPAITLPTIRIHNRIIYQQDNVTIHAEICDHNIPSAAYSLEFEKEIRVRKDQLVKCGLTPGPWLRHLKYCIATQTLNTPITLPDGTKSNAETLAKDLTDVLPGKKVAYIADMADNEANREKAIRLATGAHTLFCEAAFMMEDKEKATATQHLTLAATAYIACCAGVSRLVPFHFSKRYERAPIRVYKELQGFIDSSVEIVF